MNYKPFLGAALALSALSAPSFAYAQALTINAPGVYVLQRNISVASGDGILITATGVTLDLNGRTVSTATPGTGRGIAVTGAKGVVVKNGKIGPFAMNVFGDTIENCTFDSLQIVGNGLPPMGGPVEMGFALVAARATIVSNNTITSCNLGLIIRGGGIGGQPGLQQLDSGKCDRRQQPARSVLEPARGRHEYHAACRTRWRPRV